MKRFFALLILLAFTVRVLSAVSALIVYVASYKDTSILPLPFARKDALNMKEVLSRIPGVKIELLENPAGGDLIREFKKWIRGAKSGDTFIFYYAGHGISKGGEFYFIPSDADPEDEYVWIPFNRLKGYVKEYAPFDVKVVWLIDACYSGSVVKGRPLRAIRIEKEAFHADTNQVIITSSTGNEISHEMSDGSGGVFTVALVEGLKGAADSDRDGWIESGELYSYVEKRVEELSGGQQHPMRRGEGDIKIVANISGKLKELDKKLFDLYFAGKLSELEYKNMKALIEGRSCSGEGVEKLKKGIDDYLSGNITFEAFVEYIVKVYAGRVRCEVAGAEEQQPGEGVKREEEYTPQGKAFIHIQKGKTLPLTFQLSPMPKKLALSGVPSTVFAGSSMPIKLKAFVQGSWKDVNLKDAKVEISGESIKLENGRLVAVKPGKTTVKMEYNGASLEKVIIVRGSKALGLGTGMFVTGDLSIFGEFDFTFVFIQAQYYPPGNLFSLCGGAKYSFLGFDIKIGWQYFFEKYGTSGPFLGVDHKLFFIKPFVHIMIPLKFVGRVDGVPIMLTLGISTNFEF